MKLFPVALALFHQFSERDLQVWTQVRTDSGPYEGLLEFPGGGVEIGESPLDAVVREVEEEVGIKVDAKDARLMGIYENDLGDRKILLYVFLFPKLTELHDKGHWLNIESQLLSSPYVGKIPAPNHRIIDDLFRSQWQEQT